MIAAVAPQTPTQKRQTKRAENLAARNTKIREEYRKRYTEQPKLNGAKIYTKAYILAKIAEEYFLSMDTVEDIIYK